MVGGVHGLGGVLGAPVLVCTVAIVSVTSSRGEKDTAIIPDQKWWIMLWFRNTGYYKVMHA